VFRVREVVHVVVGSKRDPTRGTKLRRRPSGVDVATCRACLKQDTAVGTHLSQPCVCEVGANGARRSREAVRFERAVVNRIHRSPGACAVGSSAGPRSAGKKRYFVLGVGKRSPNAQESH